MKRAWHILMMLMILVGLTFCSYESRKTTIHKPGVYKGDRDQLLAMKNQQELTDRLKLVQTDR